MNAIDQFLAAFVEVICGSESEGMSEVLVLLVSVSGEEWGWLGAWRETPLCLPFFSFLRLSSFLY